MGMPGQLNSWLHPTLSSSKVLQHPLNPTYPYSLPTGPVLIGVVVAGCCHPFSAQAISLCPVATVDEGINKDI